MLVSKMLVITHPPALPTYPTSHTRAPRPCFHTLPFPTGGRTHVLCRVQKQDLNVLNEKIIKIKAIASHLSHFKG